MQRARVYEIKGIGSGKINLDSYSPIIIDKIKSKLVLNVKVVKT